MTPTLQIFLIVSAALFSIGLLAALSRRHAIFILIGIEMMLAAANLNVSILPMKAEEAENIYVQKRAHLLLIAWGTPDERAAWVERAGKDNVIDLYTLPISYRVLGDLKIDFTADGFPVATR